MKQYLNTNKKSKLTIDLVGNNQFTNFFLIRKIKNKKNKFNYLTPINIELQVSFTLKILPQNNNLLRYNELFLTIMKH